MSLNDFRPKTIYYYVLCVMAFFVLLWGMIDFAGASIGLVNSRTLSTNYSLAPSSEQVSPVDKGDQFFDAYYQKRMLLDRFWDSLVRLVVAGAIIA